MRVLEYFSTPLEITTMTQHDLKIRNTSFTKIISSLREKGFKNSAVRIEELKTIQDLEAGEKPLSFESVQGFQKFIPEFTQLGEPVLGLFPQGTLSAGWKLASNKHILIEFLDNNTVSFAMIGPSDSAPDNKLRINGRATVRDALQALCERGVTQGT